LHRTVKNRALQVELEVHAPNLRHTRFAALRLVDYGGRMQPLTAPEQLVEQPVPDITLPSSAGGTFGLRSRVGVGPLVLFFYIHNGSPG
jgi:hypothetical protein